MIFEPAVDPPKGLAVKSIFDHFVNKDTLWDIVHSISLTNQANNSVIKGDKVWLTWLDHHKYMLGFRLFKCLYINISALNWA